MNGNGDHVHPQTTLATRTNEATQVRRCSPIREMPYIAAITTDIELAGPFFYAEDYHQQYLAKNPNGYCGLGGTGVTCPVGISGV